jgi:hypothetical protein
MLKHTSEIVKAILIEDKRTRNSDSFLYLKVLKHFSQKMGQPVHKMSVQMFLLSMGDMGVPPFETVRRARQKLQRKHPELAANDTVKQMRQENEAAYYAFALEED